MKKTIIIFAIFLIIILLLFVGVFIKNKKQYSKDKDYLFSAIEEGDVNKVEKILVKNPSLINEKKLSHKMFSLVTVNSNPTPLLESIRLKKMDMVKLLIEKGADINLSNGTFKSYPIIEVLTLNIDEKYDIAKTMIDNNADLSVEQQFLTVPYAIVSVKIDEQDNFQQEQSLQLIKYVIDNNVSLIAPDPTNAQTNDVERCTNYDINSLIGLSARNNYVLVTKYLLDNDIYKINDVVSLDGTTALIQAVIGDSYGTCKLLIENGAKQDIVDSNGKTAYDYALENGNQDIIKLFSEAQ